MTAARIVSIWLMLVPAVACHRSGGQSSQENQRPSALSADAQTAAAEVLAAYEGLRAELAADAVARVPTLAERLERAASGLERGAPAPLKPHALGLAAGARELRAKKDLEQARVAFGELSRQLLAMLAIEPSLRKGRRVFECPMARGYKKWVQIGTQIENPYQGKAMLECGAESDWTS